MVRSTTGVLRVTSFWLVGEVRNCSFSDDERYACGTGILPSGQSRVAGMPRNQYKSPKSSFLSLGVPNKFDRSYSLHPNYSLDLIVLSETF